MSAARIDIATPHDAPGMARVLGDWVRQTLWMPKLHAPQDDLWFCGMLLDTCVVWVLRGPEVAGFAARDGDDLRALYLAPSARGQGHGKALLEQARAGQTRLDAWTFQANSAAIGFYLAQEFVELQRTDGARNEEKLPDLLLSWTRRAT